jgi:hypothetical protein
MTRPFVVLGPASREIWGDAWRAGYVEGLVWVQARSANEAINELRQNPEIVDVLLSGRDVK